MAPYADRMGVPPLNEPRSVSRSPWTIRVADVSARHRWPVFGLWLEFTLGLFAASLAMGGADTAAAVSVQQQAHPEANEADLVYSPPGTATEPHAQPLLA